MKTTLIAFALMALLPLAMAEPAGLEAWTKYYQSKGASFEELPGAGFSIEMVTTPDGTAIPLHTQLPPNGNKKHNASYSNGTVFLVSDSNWQEVLTYIPVSIWMSSDSDYAWCSKVFGAQRKEDFPYTTKCAYPLLVYHKEGSQYDLDSMLNFIGQYGANKAVIVGGKDSALESALAGKGVTKFTYAKTEDAPAFWDDYAEVVYARNDYATAMLAAQYASYRNAPLVIEGTASQKGFAVMAKGRKIICAGASPPAGNCTNGVWDAKRLQNEIIQLTASDKAIIVNTKDIGDDYCEKLDFTAVYGNYKLTNLYCHDSLAAPYLAVAKEEMIIRTDFERGPRWQDNKSSSKLPKLEFLKNTALISSGASKGFAGSEDKVHIEGDVLYYTNLSQGKRLDAYRISSGRLTKMAATPFPLSLKSGNKTQSARVIDDFFVYKDFFYVLDYMYYPSVITSFKLKGGAPVEYLSTFTLPFETRYSSPSFYPREKSGNLTNIYLVINEDPESPTIYVLPVSDGNIGDIQQKVPVKEFGVGHITSMVAYGDKLYVAANELLQTRDDCRIFVFELSSDGKIGRLVQTLGDFGSLPGEFHNIPEIMVYGGYLYASDPFNNRVQRFSLSIANPVADDWTSTFSGSELMGVSNNLEKYVPKVKAAIADAMPQEVISYLTYMASPPALPLSINPSAAGGFKESELSDASFDYFLVKGVFNQIKPHGRIFGLTVSDTSAYVARSVFIDKIRSNEKPKLACLIGADSALFTAYKEVASAQGGLTPLLYLDPGAWSSPGVTSDLAAPPKPQDYETFETLLVGVHGQPDSWKALSMDSPALRGLKLRPLSVLTYSCCSLCYKYTLQGKTQHKPFLGVAFIRAGAMGFLGSISSASYVHERDNLYMPIKSFIADKKTLGSLITLPLAGTTEQAWRTLFLDRYLGYYSILGDPTYKPRLSAPPAPVF